MKLQISFAAGARRFVALAGALFASCHVAFGQTPPPAAPAPAARRLTLEEAKQLALASRALTLGRLNVEQLQHATTAARKDYLPKVIANDTYFHFNDDLGSVVSIRRGTRGILRPALPPSALPSSTKTPIWPPSRWPSRSPS